VGRLADKLERKCNGHLAPEQQIFYPIEVLRTITFFGDKKMNLKEALINGQDMSASEADEAIAEMRERILEGENPEEVLFDMGLEPDYIFDLIETI
jgi:hypothetical protein